MNVDEDMLRTTFGRYEEHVPADGDLVDSVHARVRANRRKRLATIGGVLCAVLLVGGTWFVEAQTSATSDVASEGEPPGKAVGERLGLEPVAFPGGGCEKWVGYEHDWGYCLDGVTDDETELVLLSQEIMGYEMTDARKAYVSAIIELRPESDAARQAELEAILRETKPQLEPLYDPIDIDEFPGLEGQALARAAGLIPTKGVPHVGAGSPMTEIGNVAYDLDGVATTASATDAWMSRLSGRDLRRLEVPDVVGSTEAEAISVLEGLGFEVSVGRTYGDDPRGTVEFQTPRAGDRHYVAFPVRILVSDGPLATEPPPGTPWTEMPDLVGMNLDEAQRVMRDLNPGARVVTFLETGNTDTVMRQDPATGDRVYEQIDNFPGTVVHVWVDSSS